MGSLLLAVGAYSIPLLLIGWRLAQDLYQRQDSGIPLRFFSVLLAIIYCDAESTHSSPD